MSDILQGLSILVTRPEAQAKVLINKLSALGADAKAFPTIEIVLLPESSELTHIIKQLPQTKVIIFISRNAAKSAIPIIQKTFPTLPAELKIAAIGPGTAEEIKKFGLQVDLMPDDHYNSQTLLTLPELVESTGDHIIIARGQGGKEELAKTLAKRGATVTYLETYRRSLPKTDMSKALNPPPDLIVTTSKETLQNLYDMTPESMHETLLDCQLLVASSAMVEHCETLGFTHPAIVAKNPTDDAIIRALL